jgi:tRNA threonylcarbamoyladenosine biosynthesis protein TsaE
MTTPDEDVPRRPSPWCSSESAPPVAHFDLYRLTRPEEAAEIGLDEALDAAR